MRRILVKMVFPCQRSIAPNNLIIFCEAEGQSVFVGIANLMKLVDTKIVVACPVDEFEIYFVIEEPIQELETIDNQTSINVCVFNLLWALDMQLPLTCIWFRFSVGL